MMKILKRGGVFQKWINAYKAFIVYPLSIFLIFIGFNSYAQLIDNLSFIHYNTKDGLPHNAVSNLIKDKKGFLWIGTDMGISRFDGTNFKNFKQKESDTNSLKGNMNFRFALDSMGRLWVVNAGSLAYYDYKNDNFQFIKGLTTDTTAFGGSVQDICADNDEKVWITTRTALFCINIKSLKVDKIFENTERDFNRLLVDKRGFVWISSSRSGFYQYNILTQKIRYFNTSSNDYYTGLFVDTANNLWLAIKNGFFSCFDSKKNRLLTPTELKADKAMSALDCSALTTYPSVTGSNILWVATRGKGILLYDILEKKYVQHIQTEGGLTSNEIENIYIDAEGIIWIATFAGLTKLDIKPKPIRKVSFPFIKDFVLGISRIVPDAYNPRYWWIATMGSGLYKYDHINKTVIKHWALNEKEDYVLFVGWVYDVMYDKEKTLWVSYEGGLLEIDKNENIKHHNIKGKKGSRSPVYQVLCRNGDTLYLNLSKNIARYLPQSRQFEYVSFTDIRENAEPEWLRQMQFDKSGNIWVTSSAGIKKVNTKTLETATYIQEIKEKPLINNTSEVAIDDNGDIWIALTNSLSKFNPNTEGFTNFSETQGVDDGQGKFIFFDNNKRLWLYSVNGLYRYDAQRNYFDKFPTPSSMVHMMQHQTPNCRSRVGDDMYITLYNNYFAFNPEKLNTQTFPNKPFITDFKILYKRTPFDNDSVSILPKKLQYYENTLSFECTNFNYDETERIQYSYMLEGFNDTWSDTSARTTISFTNLDAGTYTLKIKSINSLGLASQEPVLFKFAILQPFWKTTWFMAFSAFSMLGLAYFYFRNREKQRLEKEKIRLQIAQDLHDEMGSELSSISILSQLAANQSVQDSLKARDILQNISDKSRNIASTMRDIVWSINPENDTFERIIQRMREYAVQVIENQDIDLLFVVSPELEESHSLPMSLRKDFLLLYKEALTNIVRHAEATTVKIELVAVNQAFILRINDNGKGFNTHQDFSGNGLKNMQSRADNIKAQLVVNSEKNKGTVIQLTLPIVA